jgi:hypothetical protein
MLTPCSPHVAGTTTDRDTDKSGAFAGQVRVHLRAYQRVLRHRPTNIQRSLMLVAATAAARYAQAVADPTVSAQDLAHYERVQRKALAHMHASFPKRQPPPALTLADYLNTRSAPPQCEGGR